MTNSEFSKLLDKKLTEVATRKDLKELATKKGLDAVKRSVKGLDKRLIKVEQTTGAKEDLKDLEGRLEFKLVQMEQRFNDKLEETFSAHTNKVLDKLDQVIGELKALREEKVFQQAQLERLEGRVVLIERRLGLG